MANIKDKIENIRKAVFGKDVRGSLADGLDAVNKETETTTLKQNHLEKTFDQLIINAGNSNAEVVDARVDKTNGTSYKKLGDRFDAHSAQMADIDNKKFDKNTMNIAVHQINKNTGKFDQTYLTDELLQQIAGNSPINAIPSYRSVTTDKIAYDSVGANEISFINVISTNLFNKGTALRDKAIVITTGLVQDYVGYALSDFIEIKPNTTYISKHVGNRVFFDKDKNYISGSSWTEEGTIITPSNSCYLRFSWDMKASPVDTTVLIEGTVLPNKYIAFGEYVLDFNNATFNRSAFDLFVNTLVNKSNIADRAVALEKTDFINIIYKNLFDKTNVVSESGVDKNDGVVRPMPGYYTTSFIPVVSGQIYNGVELGNKAYYDKDKKFISGESWVSTQLTTAPINACYIRFSFSNNFLQQQMFIKGNTLPSSYLAYNNNIIALNNCKFDESAISTQKSKLYGKKWNALGDSITFNATGYHKQIADKTGCTVRNYGISSSTVADFYTTWTTNPMVLRFANMSDDADIITVFGGVNDASSDDMPMGDINSTDIKTFYGAYNVLLDGLIKKYPTKTIATFTPLKTTNGARTVLPQIVQAVKDVSSKYGVPCLDLYNMSGISIVPEQQALLNPDKLHPNYLGHKIIGGKILTFLESIMPL